MCGRRALARTLVVAALALTAACSSGSDGSTVEAVNALLPPVELTGEQSGGLEVALTWQLDPESATPARLRVLRNGTEVAELAGDATSFTDSRLRPGRRYTYQVKAEADGEPAAHATTSVDVSAPPLAEARLAGIFDLGARVVPSEGFSAGPWRMTYTWDFTPSCGEGACPRVRWFDQPGGIRGRLERRGARYVGSYAGPFHIECRGTAVGTTARIELRVTQARALFGVWRATRVRGTITASTNEQLGCVETERTETLTGRYVAG